MAGFWVVVALSVAGGVGAGCRFVVDGLVKGRVRTAFPLGTAIINVTGSFLLGLVTGLALAHTLPPEWRLILGTGFLGGYTTFSTASFETVRLSPARLPSSFRPASVHRSQRVAVRGRGVRTPPCCDR